MQWVLRDVRERSFSPKIQGGGKERYSGFLKVAKQSEWEKLSRLQDGLDRKY